MKLFSRKALVAGATAVAVAFAGTSVATAEEETGSSEIITQSSTEEGAPAFSSNFPGSSNDDDEDPEGNSDLSSNPESIASWISVFTAIVGALAAAFSFATKYLGFKI